MDHPLSGTDETGKNNDAIQYFYFSNWKIVEIKYMYECSSEIIFYYVLHKKCFTKQN